MTFAVRKGDSLPEEDGVADFLKPITTLWKQAHISGVCLVSLFIAATFCPENNCKYRQSQHSHFRKVR